MTKHQFIGSKENEVLKIRPQGPQFSTLLLERKREREKERKREREKERKREREKERKKETVSE